MMLLYKIIQYSFGWIAKFRIRSVTGMERLPRTGAAILAFNHVSWFDPLSFAGAVLPRFRRQMHFVAITNNWWWLGAMPINRDHPGDVLAGARRLLEQGKVVAIYPEGFRNASSVLPHGKTGAARLALWSGAPVIPIGLRSLPGTKLGEIVRNMKLTRHTTIHIGPPLAFPKTAPESMTHDLLESTTAAIMHAIANESGKTYPYD